MLLSDYPHELTNKLWLVDNYSDSLMDFLLLEFRLSSTYPAIAEPTLQAKPQTYWTFWQRCLRISSFINQNARCICGDDLYGLVELHHALVSKADVRGLPGTKKSLIHHSYNCVLVHHRCHSSCTRNSSFLFLSKIYKREAIINWYMNFPFKTKQNMSWLKD